jgi:hypothetical protein
LSDCGTFDKAYTDTSSYLIGIDTDYLFYSGVLKVMMKRRIFSTLLICLPLIAPGSAFSAEKTKLVSMKVINSKGYPAKLKGGIDVRIVDLRNLKAPEKECSLDVKSLQGLNVKNFARVGKSATATINLQAKVGSKGHPYCSGEGSGCVMTIEVPDAQVLERMSR